MATKQRAAIFLRDAISKATQNRTIFIHEGTGPSLSDGYFVVPNEFMMEMWNMVDPKDAENVVSRY